MTLDAFDGTLDVLGAVGVGKPHIALAPFAKAGARDGGHIGFVEEEVLRLTRRHPGGLDVGEGVERPRRIDAGHPWQAVEGLHNQLAALVKSHHHVCHRILWPRERSQTRILGRGVHAGVIVDAQAGDIGHQ